LVDHVSAVFNTVQFPDTVSVGKRHGQHQVNLTAFQNTYKLFVETVTHVIGGHANNNSCKYNSRIDCDEANLDVQCMVTKSQVMFDLITQNIADMVHPPLVNSISYSTYENGLSQSDADSFNTETMKLSATGGECSEYKSHSFVIMMLQFIHGTIGGSILNEHK
jgi:hypothetical protein